jgi:flagellar hook protein FlgE
MSVTTEGTPPDVVTTAVKAFDAAGVAHALALMFERQADLSWTITPSLPAAEGAVLSPPITGLRFGDDGAPIGLGGLDSTITVQFAGQAAPQDIEVDLGQDGVFSGLTQFGSDGEVIVREQDGYGAGELASFSIEGSGEIRGLYTNGQNRVLGALGVATFANAEGLHHVGDNLFAETSNSGTAVLGAGAAGKAGGVVGGALENSNVDTAEQFVYLIEAQRGFQANARVISAQNEVLRDMVNLI